MGLFNNKRPKIILPKAKVTRNNYEVGDYVYYKLARWSQTHEAYPGRVVAVDTDNIVVQTTFNHECGKWEENTVVNIVKDEIFFQGRDQKNTYTGVQVITNIYDAEFNVITKITFQYLRMEEVLESISKEYPDLSFIKKTMRTGDSYFTYKTDLVKPCELMSIILVPIFGKVNFYPSDCEVPLYSIKEQAEYENTKTNQ